MATKRKSPAKKHRAARNPTDAASLRAALAAARADGRREMRERSAAEAMRVNGGMTHAEMRAIRAIAARSRTGALDTPEARIVYLLEAHPIAGAAELAAYLIRSLPVE